MRSLTVLAIPIYQALSRQYPNLTERREATKQHLLNEITKWNIKKVEIGDNYYFKPAEFKGTLDSDPFEVRLIYDTDTDCYEVKFGNLNASSDQEKFKWSDKDLNRLQKGLFLYNVLEKEVLPLLERGTLGGLQFTPYDKDGLGEDRLSYFKNMFSKLDGGKFDLTYDDESDKYFITAKQK